MTTSSTLSVVLPNYNHAKFISRALSALLSQELAPDEIIVIDDGSTDDSISVINEFASRSSSISVLLNQHNTGVIPTLERGLQAARGRYVYFAAADDWVLPGFFELAVRRLDADDDVGIFCGEAILIDGRSMRPFAVRPAVRPTMRAGRIDPNRVRELLRSTDNWILTCSAIFRREAVVSAGGFNERLGSLADGFLARKIALRSGFFFEPKAVATWVISDSVSRRTARSLQQAAYMLDVAPTLIAADPEFPVWYADAFRNRWRFATCRLALDADQIDRDFLLTMGARSTEERKELEKLLALPGRWLPRLAIMALLWYRLRPTALTALLRTMLAMRTVRLTANLVFLQFRSKWTANATSGRE
jgi:glycosyltransferase involved in cell wall biosynthesis